jgi:hypothetical protein
MARNNAQFTKGLLTSLLSLTCVFVIGGIGTLKHLDIHASSDDHSFDNWFISTLVLMLLLSIILPVCFRVRGFKEHARGSIWGTIGFYLLAVVLLGSPILRFI